MSYGIGDHLLYYEKLYHSVHFNIIIFILYFDGPNCPGDMTLPVSINPYKPIIISETRLPSPQSSTSYCMIKKTEKFYDASKYTFTPIIKLQALDSANVPYRGSQIAVFSEFIPDDSLKFSILLYNNPEKSSVILGEFCLVGDSIKLEIKLKLLEKGNYWLFIGSLTSGNSKLQGNYMDNCRGREILFNLLSPDNNIELMRKYRFIDPNYSVLSDSITKFYNRASYCFEVR
ncbi:MAG: hypothetical protein IPK61_13405 [Saprospiraceae bacterium]|nr:hypothetical protein [Saprospiraceae bacterium]